MGLTHRPLTHREIEKRSCREFESASTRTRPAPRLPHQHRSNPTLTQKVDKFLHAKFLSIRKRYWSDDFQTRFPFATYSSRPLTARRSPNSPSCHMILLPRPVLSGYRSFAICSKKWSSATRGRLRVLHHYHNYSRHPGHQRGNCPAQQASGRAPSLSFVVIRPRVSAIGGEEICRREGVQCPSG